MDNNTSGQGKESVIPPEIQGWNWGAVLLSWIWGIGSNTYRAFWVFCPVVNAFMIVYLGLKGNEWAWRHRRWESIAHFKKIQKKWVKAGLTFVSVILFFCIAVTFLILSIFKDSEPYKISMNYVTNSQEVMSRVGLPVEIGFVSGNMQTSGPEGFANISYSIEGSSGEATIAVKAIMEMSIWSIECLIVNYEGSNDTTILVPCN